MPRQLSRKRVLLAKTEITYGVDSNPTGVANAVLTRDLTIQLFQGNTEEIDYDRPYLSNGKQLYTGPYTVVTFECDFSGSGAAGIAPSWGPLLKACGCAETLRVAATGTSTASTINSVTLAGAASAVDGAYVGQAISIAGQTRQITSYVGSTKVATVSPPFASAPANGTYNVLAQTDYKPISDTFSSVTLYFYQDGELHKLLGARGTCEIKLTKESLPTMSFTMTGLRVAPALGALPTVNFDAFVEPLPVNNVNSSSFSLFGYAPCFEEIGLDLGVQVQYRNLVGCEEVPITDRAPTGNVVFEKPLLSDFNYDAAVANYTLGAVTAIHGTTANNIVGIVGRAQLVNPSLGDSDGIVTLNGDLRFVPTNAGNDEFTIFAR